MDTSFLYAETFNALIQKAMDTNIYYVF